MSSITLVNSVSNPAPSSCSGVASSSNGQILYGSFQQEVGYDFYTSTNGGVSWSALSGASPGLNGRYTDITCDSTGSILYTPWQGGNFYKSTNSGSTWLNITNTLGNGEDGSNIVGVATDSTGTKLIVCTGDYIYISSDSGATWTSSSTFSPSTVYRVACSSDFTVRFAIIGTNIKFSTDPANLTWTTLPGNITASWTSLTCSADGTKVFATDNASNLYYFSGGVPVTLIPAPSSIGVISSYSNGLGLVSSGGGLFTTYSLTYTPPPCFKDDSQILCLKDGKEVYRKVQDIRKGDLIKTLRNGYLAVDMIGTTKLSNSKANHDEHKLYRCSKEKYPELTEDLIITGHHSILVSNITDDQREKLIKTMGKIYITDNRYRLVACVDERAVPFEEEGVFNIWHIALENDDYYSNYGIYANGLLVETCSKRYLKEISGMTLL